MNIENLTKEQIQQEIENIDSKEIFGWSEFDIYYRELLQNQLTKLYDKERMV